MFRQLFDADSGTYTYLLADPTTGRAVLIDPVIQKLDRDLELIQELGLRLTWVLDTHVHADHVTAAAALKARTHCRIAAPASTEAVGVDRLLHHGDRLNVDVLDLECRFTPGHTLGSAVYVDHVHGRVFTGDTLLIRGCGRTDFQGGDARVLFRSVHAQLFSLPDHVFVYPGHDYAGRTVSTIGEEKAHNKRLGGGREEEDFVTLMGSLNLPAPRLLDVAVPRNRVLGAEPDPWIDLPRADGVNHADIPWVLTHQAGLQLVDVREPSEFHGPLGHAPGALHAPLGTLSDAAATWDRDQPLVTICHSGMRSMRAAQVLESMGFRKVASMDGGMAGWHHVHSMAS